MQSTRPLVRPTGFDRMLAPLHRWIWRDAGRRVQKLIRFGETETDGGRDILRAAEVTADPLLRRLYLVHAIDELRHGVLGRAETRVFVECRVREEQERLRSRRKLRLGALPCSPSQRRGHNQQCSTEDSTHGAILHGSQSYKLQVTRSKRETDFQL